MLVELCCAQERKPLVRHLPSNESIHLEGFFLAQPLAFIIMLVIFGYHINYLHSAVEVLICCRGLSIPSCRPERVKVSIMPNTAKLLQIWFNWCFHPPIGTPKLRACHLRSREGPKYHILC